MFKTSVKTWQATDDKKARMRSACRMPKSRNTHSEYEIFFTFPLSHDYTNVLQCWNVIYVRVHCLSYYGCIEGFRHFIILGYIASLDLHDVSWFQTFAVFWMLYVFFWIIPRRLNFTCQRFGTLCLFLLCRRVGTYPPTKKEDSVPKRWHVKFRRRGITQNKSHNLHYVLQQVLAYTMFMSTGCSGGNVPDFEIMFLKLKYTDTTQNTYYIRS
jgi:hypothetical protein